MPADIWCLQILWSPPLELLVQHLAKFCSQETMVRAWALPESFAGSNILLPTNLGNSLWQQLKAMYGSCQHFVLLLQRSISKQAGLANQQDSHTSAQHPLKSIFGSASQAHSYLNASRSLLLQPEKTAKNHCTVRNSKQKKLKKELWVGDLHSRW